MLTRTVLKSRRSNTTRVRSACIQGVLFVNIKDPRVVAAKQKSQAFVASKRKLYLYQIRLGVCLSSKSFQKQIIVVHLVLADVVESTTCPRMYIHINVYNVYIFLEAIIRKSMQQVRPSRYH